MSKPILPHRLAISQERIVPFRALKALVATDPFTAKPPLEMVSKSCASMWQARAHRGKMSSVPFWFAHNSFLTWPKPTFCPMAQGPE